MAASWFSTACIIDRGDLFSKIWAFWMLMKVMSLGISKPRVLYYILEIASFLIYGVFTGGRSRLNDISIMRLLAWLERFFALSLIIGLAVFLNILSILLPLSVDFLIDFALGLVFSIGDFIFNASLTFYILSFLIFRISSRSSSISSVLQMHFV